MDRIDRDFVGSSLRGEGRIVELNRRRRLGGTSMSDYTIESFRRLTLQHLLSENCLGVGCGDIKIYIMKGSKVASMLILATSANAVALPSFSFADISSCTPITQREVEEALQKSGGFSINGVPDYDGGAVPSLPHEIQEQTTDKKSRTRSSYAAASAAMEGEDTLSVLPEEVQGLRSATMGAMEVLGRCMSIDEVKPGEGEVVEHLHFYTGGEEEEDVMPYHTDAGYMIAMTSGGEGDSYTLLVGDEGDEEELGTVGELVVMVGEQVRVGEGGVGWGGCVGGGRGTERNAKQA